MNPGFGGFTWLCYSELQGRYSDEAEAVLSCAKRGHASLSERRSGRCCGTWQWGPRRTPGGTRDDNESWL